MHSFVVMVDNLVRLPERVNRGVGLTSRQAIAEAQAIAKRQLENRFWLLIFDNRTLANIWALNTNICLEISDRLDIGVSCC